MRIIERRINGIRRLSRRSQKIEKTENETERKTRERRMRFYLKNDVVKTNILCYLFDIDYAILYLPIKEKYSDELVYS
ncbi:hypothetical protein [Alkalibaculum bacchi]|uniref:hypothetical protein n=1 Tax=Alkalibaculum bacchi TaxID=645887 RepID=UPI0026F03CD6|nr:hypothetical protein [Alkalibaculum bacchi]